VQQKKRDVSDGADQRKTQQNSDQQFPDEFRCIRFRAKRTHRRGHACFRPPDMILAARVQREVRLARKLELPCKAAKHGGYKIFMLSL
jgi:hypothetical protein